jgi:hypothetical protein
VAARVAVAADLGELRALRRLTASAALHRGRVEQEQIIAAPGAHAAEDAGRPRDRLREAAAAFVEGVLARRHREEVSELTAGAAQEPTVGRPSHGRLGDVQGDDLGIVELAVQ